MAIGLYPDASAQTPQGSIDIYYDIVYRYYTGGQIWAAGESSGNNFGFWTAANGQSFGSAIAYIDTSGNYHQASDLRLKRDITSLDHTLDRLLQLRPVSYHFRSEAANSSPTLGFIAQEVQPLFPEAVGEQTNGVKDLVYSELIPVAIRSIQELNQKVEAGSQKSEVRSQETEERIQNLESENAEMKQRLEKLERWTNEKSGGAKCKQRPPSPRPSPPGRGDSRRTIPVLTKTARRVQSCVFEQDGEQFSLSRGRGPG